VLNILTHADLTHKAVLVAIHTSELTNVSKNVLETISELEGINVTETVLNMGVDDELGETENLTTKMEGVTKARLLALLGGERLHRLEVEIVVKMQVVQVLTMDEEVKHVITLATDLKTSLDPIELSGLEELGGLKGTEEILLVEGFWWCVVKLVKHPNLEHLLVRHSHLDRLVRWAVLLEPLVDKWNVESTAHEARTLVEWTRCPVECDTSCSVICVKRGSRKNWLHSFRKLEVVIVILNLAGTVCGDRIDDWVIVKCRKVWVLGLNVHHRWVMEPDDMNRTRARVVKERIGDLVLGTDLLSDNNLVNIVELIPILIGIVHIAVKWLKLRSTGDSHIKSL